MLLVVYPALNDSLTANGAITDCVSGDRPKWALQPMAGLSHFYLAITFDRSIIGHHLVYCEGASTANSEDCRPRALCRMRLFLTRNEAHAFRLIQVNNACVPSSGFVTNPNENVQNLPILIERTPQVYSFAANEVNTASQVPLGMGQGSRAP